MQLGTSKQTHTGAMKSYYTSPKNYNFTTPVYQSTLHSLQIIGWT